jgi:hypothetical protein
MKVLEKMEVQEVRLGMEFRANLTQIALQTRTLL